MAFFRKIESKIEWQKAWAVAWSLGVAVALFEGLLLPAFPDRFPVRRVFGAPTGTCSVLATITALLFSAARSLHLASERQAAAGDNELAASLRRRSTWVSRFFSITGATTAILLLDQMGKLGEFQPRQLQAMIIAEDPLIIGAAGFVAVAAVVLLVGYALERRSKR